MTLPAFGQTTLAGPFGVVGFGTVLVEQEQGEVGDVPEFFRSDTDRSAHQVDLDLVASLGVDETGQFVDGLTDDPDVLAVDQPEGLGGCGRREDWRHRLAGERLSRSQQSGLGQSAAGFGGRNAPAGREHVPPRLGTHLLGCRLGLQAGQQPVALGGQLAGKGLQLVGHGLQFGAGQQVEVAGGQRVVSSTQRRDPFQHNRSRHTSNIHSTSDRSHRSALTV